MFNDNDTASGATECTAPSPATARSARAAAIDLRAVIGARRGFERLIINRGRPSDRERGEAVAAHARALHSAHLPLSPVLDVGIAESRDQIEATNRLIYERYSRRGYAVEAFDHESRTARGNAPWHEITFFVADREATLGTITLRLDGPEGLRAEATHPERLQYARADGRRLGELTRLAIADGGDSRLVLASLFGLVYAVGRMMHSVTDVYIEVNPRHVGFYSRALGFAVAGETRFCHRVRAPSVLLHLDVELLDEQLGFAALNASEESELRYGT